MHHLFPRQKSTETNGISFIVFATDIPYMVFHLALPIVLLC